MSANLNNIPVLTGTNFGQWKEHITVLLDCMDLDYAFRHDRLAPLTDDLTSDQNINFDKWERSNCMRLMIMRMSIPESLRGSITEKEDAKFFLKELVDRFTLNKRVETTTLLMKLVFMRYTGKDNIREYIMEMSTLVTRLKTLKLDMSESVLYSNKKKKKGNGKSKGKQLAITRDLGHRV
ncbi:uncharacterized protein LOC122042704 [Zingiber officinale]|uniref:uncharacterized protein LOC122042704 n=1 Tax=Zingiber officinale TaxID=94328 RepID=UPI001C4D7A0E|nr:uncharacterized protein LOC122042704 [Zingiber officinale]